MDYLIYIVILIVFTFVFFLMGESDYLEADEDVTSPGDDTIKAMLHGLKCKFTRNGNAFVSTFQNRGFTIKRAEKFGYLLSVSLYLPVSGKVKITNENLTSNLKKKFGKEDILSGDSSFDDDMLISADNPEEAAALLNGKARKRIAELSARADSFAVSNSSISVCLENMEASSRVIAGVVKESVGLSKELMRSSSIKKRLMRNALSDPVESVRLKNLNLFATYCSDAKDAQAFYKKTLKDPSLEMQVEGASHLGERGMKHLAGLLARKENFSPSIVIRIAGLFRDHEFRSGIEELKDAFVQSDDKTVHVAILKAFETLGDEDLSPFLAARLDETDSGVQLHVIKALSRSGTVDVMKKLHVLSKKNSSGKIREEANSTMARIQERLGVDQGWLSVSELNGSEGALSLSEKSREGALSMIEKKNKKSNAGSEK